MKSKCEHLVPQLSAYVDGELPDKEQVEVRKHLETCQTCRELVHELDETGAILKDALSRGAEPKVDLTGVWEEIEARADFGPSLWTRIKNLVERPVFWLPAAVATAAAVLLVFMLPFQKIQAPMELSRVESIYSQSGQVMVLQTAKSGQPIIWILPGPEKEVDS